VALGARVRRFAAGLIIGLLVSLRLTCYVPFGM
jgi:hypothetical protein